MIDESGQVFGFFLFLIDFSSFFWNFGNLFLTLQAKDEKVVNNMSTATLTSLVEYLIGTLTPSDMRWVSKHLTEYADKQEAPLPSKRYTKEEMNAILDEAEANFVAGKGIPDEEAWDDLEEELALQEEEQHEMA